MEDRSQRRFDPGDGLQELNAGDTPSQEMPRDVALRLKRRSQLRARSEAQRASAEPLGGFLRQTYALPRDQARERARDWFIRYPKAAYMTAVESWRQLEDGRIEFTMRRLPTAD
ncbi:hypothetical protein SAMN05444161_1786 [Rhizobiales bacterium GAS191]|nr:hypothetical protein SAMN05444161_1786 [Rhizobiales bacterium GAS191]